MPSVLNDPSFFDNSIHQSKPAVNTSTENILSDEDQRLLFDDEFYEKMNNEITLGKKDLFEEYLKQLEGIITQAYNDKIELAEKLRNPVGNAENYVDFLRKAMNGTFVKEEVRMI